MTNYNIHTQINLQNSSRDKINATNCINTYKKGGTMMYPSNINSCYKTKYHENAEEIDNCAKNKSSNIKPFKLVNDILSVSKLQMESFTTKSDFEDLDLYNPETDIQSYINELNEEESLDTDELDDILKNYENMKEERHELSDKINKIDNGNNDTELHYNNVTYSTLLITALGTSAIYLIFRQL